MFPAKINKLKNNKLQSAKNILTNDCAKALLLTQ